ncbi:MAG TPA: ATP synthase subunit I [Terriglobales bacterium]|nr:ATP synthase subunit I [Terriglobales bacterium]
MNLVLNPLEPELRRQTASDAFYSRALPRIRRFMLALAVPLAVFICLRFGWKLALGFVVGCAIAYVNFHWLKRTVSSLADRLTATGKSPSSAGVVLRFLARYFLMALAAYVIFAFSPASLYGLFAGLFLPVGAIMCEAGYELYAALRWGL